MGTQHKTRTFFIMLPSQLQRPSCDWSGNDKRPPFSRFFCTCFRYLWQGSDRVTVHDGSTVLVLATKMTQNLYTTSMLRSSQVEL